MKTKVVLHHTADSSTEPQYDKVWKYHDSGAGGKWPKGHGIQYAYFLERDGVIMKGRNEGETTWHSGKWLMNKMSIAICLAGDFTKQNPTREQTRSLKLVLTDIQKRRGISNNSVLLHREVKSTSCPGVDLRKFIVEDFPDDTLKKRIVQLQKAKKRAKPRRRRILHRLLRRLLIRESSS